MIPLTAKQFGGSPFNAERKILSSAERASIAFGWSPAKPATAFRISFAGNPHPLQRWKHSAVFPPVKRFVRLCRMGRGQNRAEDQTSVEPFLSEFGSGDLTNHEKLCPFDKWAR